jgi:hypothetical protein
MLLAPWWRLRQRCVDKTVVGDYDEQRRRVSFRVAPVKSRRALSVELHPGLADALEGRLSPRDDRVLAARLFAGSGTYSLRTSMAKACKATGIPTP